MLSSMGTLNNVCPHQVYKMAINVVCHTKNYWMGKNQPRTQCFKKMSKAIQSDEMIG